MDLTLHYVILIYLNLNLNLNLWKIELEVGQNNSTMYW